MYIDSWRPLAHHPQRNPGPHMFLRAMHYSVFSGFTTPPAPGTTPHTYYSPTHAASLSGLSGRADMAVVGWMDGAVGETHAQLTQSTPRVSGGGKGDGGRAILWIRHGYAATIRYTHTLARTHVRRFLLRLAIIIHSYIPRVVRVFGSLTSVHQLCLHPPKPSIATSSTASPFTFLHITTWRVR